MILYSDLQRITSARFPGARLTLGRMLVAWCEIDPCDELAHLFRGSDMTLRKMEKALQGYIDSDDAEGREILLDSITGVAPGQEATAADILAAVCRNPEYRITKALRTAGLDVDEVLVRIAINKEPKSMFSDLYVDLDVNLTPFLRFGWDMTAQANAGEFADLYPRPNETNRIRSILLRKRKPNPVLTGPAGVGKTQLANLMALEAAVEPSSPLRGVRFLGLSMGKLVAGTKYRGEFERRFEETMASLQALTPAVLFIDEIHLLFGAGRAEGGAMDGANLIKPNLTQDQIRVIGATTHVEFQRYFSTDTALKRRFQEIKINAPQGQALSAIVRHQAGILSKHHGVSIESAVTEEAIMFSNQYMVNRNQPDKSIDLLDTAAANVRQAGRTDLGKMDLVETVASMTGLSVNMIGNESLANLLNLEAKLKAGVIGQNEAIERVVSAIAHRRLGIGDPNRPLGVFLFCGDTGVGKTELAKVLADSFWGAATSLIRIDLGEHLGPSAVHKLIGAPAGLIGHETEGLLIQGLQRCPSCLILFDEIEKASPEVHQMLLGLLDEGRITSAKGEFYDVRQCIIVMTTNAVSVSDFSKGPPGFTPNRQVVNLEERLRRIFPSEFIGRMDDIVMFNSLQEDDIKKIIAMRLNESILQLNQKSVELRFDKKTLIAFLYDQLNSNKNGVRGVARIIEKRLLQPIALSLLEKGQKHGITVVINNEFYEKGTILIY